METVSAQLTSNWKSTNTKHMKDVKNACEVNLELQILVIQTIDKYKKGVCAASAAGTSMAALVSKKRKTAGSVDNDNKPYEYTEMDKPITHGRAMYSRWSKVWLRVVERRDRRGVGRQVLDGALRRSRAASRDVGDGAGCPDDR